MFSGLFKSVGDIAKGSGKVAKGVVTLNPEEVGSGVTTTVSGAANTATLGIFREDEDSPRREALREEKKVAVQQKNPSGKSQSRGKVRESNNQAPKTNTPVSPSAPALPKQTNEDSNEDLRKEVALLKQQLETQRLMREKQRLRVLLEAEQKQASENGANNSDPEDEDEASSNFGPDGFPINNNDEPEEGAANFQPEGMIKRSPIQEKSSRMKR